MNSPLKTTKHWLQSLHKFARTTALAAAFAAALAPCPAVAQPKDTDVIANRLLVVYRTNTVPDSLAAQVKAASADKAHVALRVSPLGVAVLQADSPDALVAVQQRLTADQAVAYVVHDRVLHGSRLSVAPVAEAAGTKPIQQISKTASPADWFYTSTPQGWAVKQVGAYGANIPGGPATGPWNASMGRGVRIAVLDSGISSTHPDTAPNLVFQQSLVDQTAVPSPCDDGSPEDQDGHGTFAASLAAGAAGQGTGMVVGVAPQASLLNIKVLQRVPAAGPASVTAQCEQGTTAGLMSWLIAGIALASQKHADIISLSAGGLLDSYSGEAEGVIAAFNRAIYNATQAGALVVAAAGNDGESLDNNRYIEMPAQAHDALAVVATTNPRCAENLSPGATCQAGNVALTYYSNYGTTLQSVAAPGGSFPQDTDGTGVTGFIRGACSTGLKNSVEGLPSQPGHSFGCFALGHTAYVEAIGTSASAPLVAGVAAIVKGAHPDLTPGQLAAALRASSVPLTQNSSSAAPSVVNAAMALQAVTE